MKKTVVISINAAWNVYNFRAGLVRALLAAGYDVVALAPPDEFSARLEDMGCRFVPMPMDNKGVSPIGDFALLLRYRKALKRIRPDVYLGYTIKPNVYGSLAAHSLGIPTINNISGLGTAFIRKNLLTKIVQGLYRTALRRAHTVYFQNEDDRQEFVRSKLVRFAQTDLVPGSGINLTAYAPDAKTGKTDSNNRHIKFLMIARLVRDKGIGEYVDAARKIRSQYPQARFSVLGFLGVANRTAIEKEDVEIPSMLLQPIVENAVNHGLFHKIENGSINIEVKYLDSNAFKVFITDDGIGVQKAKEIYKNSAKNYRSNSSEVLQERLLLLKQSGDWDIEYNIKDLSDNSLNCGTEVSIMFKYLFS